MRRGWIALAETASLAALAGGVWHEHSVRGVEGDFFGFALFLAPIHFRRVLAFFGLVTKPPLPLLLMEGAALAGLFSYPVAFFGVALALGLALLLAAGRPRGTERSRLASATGTLTLLAGAAFLARDVQHGADFSVARLALFAPLLLEGFAPWTPRTPGAALARTAAAFTIIGTSIRLEGFCLGTFLALLASTLLCVSALVSLAGSRRDERAHRRLAIRASAPLLVLALFFLGGEALFRIVPNRYESLVPPQGDYSHAPREQDIYEGAPFGPKQANRHVIVRNTGGYHDVVHELAKPPATARIVVLGDSYVEGAQVELEELYHRKLVTSLTTDERRVETISISHSGWGQRHEAFALEKTGLAYHPDLVIVEFLPGNDVRNNSPELDRLANEEAFRSTSARVLFIESLNAGLAFHAFVFDKLDLTLRNLERRSDPIDADVYRIRPHAYEALWQRAWSNTEFLLARMQQLSAAAGAECVVVIFTSPDEIRVADLPASGDLDWRLPARRVIEICGRHAIPCLDLAPRFARLPAEKRGNLHLSGDGHWTALGHDEAAKETTLFLTRETAIWKTVLAK